MAKELVFDVKVNNLDSTQKTFGQLKQEIKDLRKELEATDIGSDKFEELTTQMQKAQFQMREIKADFKDLSQTSMVLGDLSEGASAIARGFGMAASAAALFGEENEKAAQEAIKNIVALTSLAEGLGQLPQMAQGLTKTFDVLKANPFMAITAAVIGLLAATGNLNEIMEMLGEVFNQVMSSLQPVIDELMALLSDALAPLMDLLMPLIKLALIPLTLNMKLLGIVLEALMPVLDLLVVGIELVSGVLTDIVESVLGAVDAFLQFIGLSPDIDKSIKKTKTSFDEYKKTQDGVRDSNELLNKSSQRQIDLMKAQGKSIDEIEKKELNLIKAKISQAEAEVKLAKSIKDRLVIEGKQLTPEQIKSFTEVEQNFLDLKNQLAIKEADIDKRKKEESKKNFDKRVEDSKKAYDELLKKQQEFIAQSNKNLDQEFIKKETDLLMQFGQGRIQTESELSEKLNQLSVDRLNSQKALLEQEILDINNSDKLKSEDKIKLTTQLGDQLIKLDSDIAKKQVDNRKKSDAEIEKQEKDSFEKRYGQERLNLIQQYANGEFKTKEELEFKLAQLDLQKSREELSRLDSNSKEYIDKLTDITQKEIALKEMSAEAQKKADDDVAKKRQENLDKASLGISVISELTATVGNVLNEISQRNIAAIQQETDEKMMSLEKQKEAGIISEAEFQKGVEKIQAEGRKKELAAKKKAFNQDKATRIVQAAMGTAQGVVAALANPFPLNIIMSTLAGVVGAAQIALIASQKFPEGGSAGGASSASSGGISAPQAAATDLSTIQAPTFGPNTGAVGGASGIAGDMNNTPMNQPQPQRVYVVETDITSTQNRVEVVEDRAKIG
jgi:hypothetical protein